MFSLYENLVHLRSLFSRVLIFTVLYKRERVILLKDTINLAVNDFNIHWDIFILLLCTPICGLLY